MVAENLVAKYAHIAVVVAAYWTISILTVFVNKTLLSSDYVNLDAPLFVTWYQCIVSSTICFSLSKLAKFFPNSFSFPEGSPLDPAKIVKVLPLSVLFIGMVSFNNLCLKYVDVVFYYVGRSLTTVFNVIFTYIILGQRTSLPAMACCGLIIVGFWLGVDQESMTGSLSIQGTIYGILGSLALTLYSIYTKRVLPYVNNEIWLLSYCINVYSSILFVPLISLTGEVPMICNYDKIFTSSFWGLMTVGGICGFLIGFATALQIKVTSPLTHNVSGTAKACAQTVIATYWYDNTRSFLWWISNWIVLGGSALYAKIKQLEMQKEHERIKPQDEEKFIENA